MCLGVLLVGIGLGCETAPSSSALLSPPCGSGEIQVSLGTERPFKPFDSTPPQWNMEYGLQGGYHIDLSFRFTGQFNPDQVDFALLLTSPPFPLLTLSSFDQYYTDLQSHIQTPLNPPTAFPLFGLHDTRQWYLLLSEEDDLDLGCYFYKARIFLYTAQGDIPTSMDLMPLHQTPSQLWLRLTTQDQVFFWNTSGTLNWIEDAL